jgi:hypothetical protein
MNFNKVLIVPLRGSSVRLRARVAVFSWLSASVVLAVVASSFSASVVSLAVAAVGVVAAGRAVICVVDAYGSPVEICVSHAFDGLLCTFHLRVLDKAEAA